MRCYKDGDLSKGGFRFLPNGTLCIDVCSENQPLQNYLSDIKRFVSENNIKKIFINADLEESIDISFLYDMKTIEDIQISALAINLNSLYAINPKRLYIQKQKFPFEFEKLKENIEDINIYNLCIENTQDYPLDDSILSLKKLKSFGLSYFNRKDSDIISKMTWLEELNLAYCKDKNFDASIFIEMKKLKKLILQNVPFELFSQFKNLTMLEEIRLTKININSLQGFENFRNLKYLTLNYCSNLKDISQISSCSNLKKLEFDTCKKMENFDSLSTLKLLKGLVMSNCGSVPSLGFIKSMSSLKFLSFVNTNIIDGDLTECMKLENVGTNDRKHYNVLSKNLPKNKEYSFWKL